MSRSPRRPVVFALSLLAMVALAAGCAGSDAAVPVTPTTALASPTVAAITPVAAEALATPLPAIATATIAADQDAPKPKDTPAMPTSTPSEPIGDLGLAAGAQRLAAALEPIASGIILQFERGTTADGTLAWVGSSPDGDILAEIIGPEDSPVTASVAVLLPEGDVRARQRAGEALYQTIGAAMPERAWATAWLDERIDEALAGTPFSTTHGDYYVQVVRLTSPQPCIYLAVTLEPQTLAMPNWHQLGTPSGATVDAWDRLPVMPAPVRGQHLPTDDLDLYEYTVDASAQAAQAFYEDQMSKAGWELVDHAIVGDPAYPENDQIVLVYRRGAEGAIVTIDWLASLQQALVTLGYAEDAADLPAIAG